MELTHEYFDNFQWGLSRQECIDALKRQWSYSIVKNVHKEFYCGRLRWRLVVSENINFSERFAQVPDHGYIHMNPIQNSNRLNWFPRQVKCKKSCSQKKHVCFLCRHVVIMLLEQRRMVHGLVSLRAIFFWHI